MNLYILLAAPNSRRRILLADLIEAGLSPDDKPAILLAATEPKSPADEKLSALAPIHRFTFTPPIVRSTQVTPGTFTAPDIGSSTTHLFLLSDSRQNPVDQLEALRPFIIERHLEVAKIITIVDCQLASATPVLAPWYDALVHFSDIVLLNKRENVQNKFISDFTNRYKNQHFPCLFELIKNDRLANPALILDDRPRRMSLYFDPEEIALAIQQQQLANLEIETTGTSTDDKENSDEEDDTDAPTPDPYFTRLPHGPREQQIPDITRHLPT